MRQSPPRAARQPAGARSPKCHWPSSPGSNVYATQTSEMKNDSEKDVKIEAEFEVVPIESRRREVMCRAKDRDASKHMVGNYGTVSSFIISAPWPLSAGAEACAAPHTLPCRQLLLRPLPPPHCCCPQRSYPIAPP
jgi:hypothetical protein